MKPTKCNLFLSFFLIATCLCGLLCLPALAAESTPSTAAPVAAGTAGESPDSVPAQNDPPVQNDPPAQDDPPVQDGADAPAGGISEAVQTLFRDRLPELFSGLSILCSLGLALLYRRGLLPTLSGALRSIGDASGKAAQQAEEGAERVKGGLARMEEILSPLPQALRDLSAGLAAESHRLDALGASLSAQKDDLARFARILEGQTEVLYGILQAAALPQYQKEAVSESYAGIRRAIAALRAAGPAPDETAGPAAGEDAYEEAGAGV